MKIDQLLFLLFFVGSCLTNIPIAKAMPSKKCVAALTGFKSDSTSDLISYFSQLLERQMVGSRELVRLIEGIKKDQWLNPIHSEQAKTNSALQIQREAIEEYFENTKLDKTKILEWAENALQENDRVHLKRGETRADTKNLYQKIEFNPVPAGGCLMGDSFGGGFVNVKLTHPFEAMSTPVTQNQWVELMGENPSHFATGDDIIAVEVNGKSILLNPDYPVENITWWSALVFANRLSVKHGLLPAYDLSKVIFKKETFPENGTYDAIGEGDQIIAPEGNIYLAEGYRLPTEAEQEYLLKAAGTATGIYFFGNDKSELINHAWFEENAGETTHPVATLDSLIINGREFFDLYGNVSEWGNDRHEFRRMGGENPFGPKQGDSRVSHGGSYLNGARSLPSSRRSPSPAGNRHSSIGFRLVRTLGLENQNKKSTPQRSTK